MWPALAALVLAAAPGTQVVDEQHSALGTTWTLRSDAAAFPARGARYSDDRVVVFVPTAWKPAKPPRPIDVVIFYHGHFDTALHAAEDKQLREQLAKSRKPVWLVVPQLAESAHDSSAGKLEQPGGVQRLLDAVLTTLAPRVGAAPTLGRVGVAAHSGGFQGAAFAVSQGRVPVVDVVLFDALYGYSARFARWLAEDAERRLTHVYRPGPGNRMVVKWTDSLAKALRFHKVPFVEQSGGRYTPVAEQVLFLRTEVPHGEVPRANDLFGEWLYHSRLGQP